MFQITRSGINRLDIELNGKLDSTGMKTLINELAEQADSIEHGRMLCRINNFDLPTLGAIGVELSRIPVLFRTMRRFDHAAVVADKRWIRTLSEAEGALIPGLKVKAFDNSVEAEGWLSNPK